MAGLWKKHKIEFFLVGASIFLVFISIAIFFNLQRKNQTKITFNQAREEAQVKQPEMPKIFVDLAGAVEKPGVYELREGARLKDVIVLANGLSASADREFIARNFNFAKKLVDQEKIYIPSDIEIKQNSFKSENLIATDINNSLNSSSLINVNTASLAQLDKLPGVGPVTAGKIISGRPYGSIDELLTKKAVSKSVFEKIKELIRI